MVKTPFQQPEWRKELICTKASLFLFCILTVFSCSSNKEPHVTFQILRADLHLGEYLQVLSDQNLVTVSRAGTPQGLVHINTKTQEISVIDAEASEARDILASADKIIYRVGEDLFLSGPTRIKLMSKVKEVETFQWFEGYGRLFFETTASEHRWLTFDSNGAIIADGTAFGTARDSLKLNNDHWVISQTPRGLFLSIFRDRLKDFEQQIQITADPLSGFYVKARIIKSQVWIAHLNEEDGLLSLSQAPVASLSDLRPNWSTTRVDGDPKHAYRGMDIAIASWHDQPVLYYLDGWALRLREAQLTASGWKTREIPIKGSGGFYTQVVNETPESITLATHNFRTMHDSIHSTFEDLMLFTLKPN